MATSNRKDDAFPLLSLSFKYRSHTHAPEQRARFCFLRLHHLRHGTFACSLYYLVLLHAIMVDHRHISPTHMAENNTDHLYYLEYILYTFGHF